MIRSALLALALMAVPAAAQERPVMAEDRAPTATAELAPNADAWPGPNLGRRPNLIRPDVDFVVSEICFRYLLTGASIDEVVRRQGVTPQRRAPGAFWIGNPGLIVTLREDATGRVCEFDAAGGDADDLAAIVRARLAQVPLTLSPAQYPPGRYRAREFLCGPVDGPHVAALVSYDGLDRDLPRVRATLRREPARNARCDQPAAVN